MKATYAETLLSIRGVGLRYGTRQILKGVNAEIKDIQVPGKTQGQVVGLLGPSGIGKTQLFRIIAGLQSPTEGGVYVPGPVGLTPVKRGLVGVVHQSYPLFEHRTVLGNLMLVARHQSRTLFEANVKVRAILERFKLYEWRHSYPCELSGGQKQRVAIAQQILCSEHLLLLDEPFSGLDMAMEQEVCHLIAEIAAADELNTIIVVTHDITAAIAVSDHLWLMGRERDKDGTIIPGAKIVQEYDLVARDLCWHPEIVTTEDFAKFVIEVKARFLEL